ncbi:MAG: MBL fold metallo-hydrolase [Candidatus Omnitrophica bacterium]|nr:MBL fold metallo-hydrolase [Candidatus Omnitrophota bacterium]
MKIKVLFDKDSKDKRLHTGRGVSFLVDDKILFDTGEKGEWLLENMRSLGVDIDRVEAIVISHDHWDHWGGLWDMLKKRGGLKVYACPRFGGEFKEKVKGMGGELIEAGKFTEVSKDVFITGEIAGAYNGRYMPEQALAIRTGNGISVITGCAHPGIVKMVEKAAQKFPGEDIYTVLGGFHLKQSDRRAIEIVVENFRKIGVKKAGPTHCSGEVAEEIFRKEYGTNFVKVLVGQTLEI